MVATLFSIYSTRIVLIIDKTVLILMLLLFLITHFIFFMWLRSAYLIRNSMTERDMLLKSEKSRGKENQSFLINSNNNSSSLTPTPTNILQKANGSDKFGSIFQTIDNIDKVNYYSHRKKSITDNVKIFFGSKSKNNSNGNSGMSFSKIQPHPV